jgi:predicted regulator of Ras-like GTPase activity (Roadblock/LC7/MglB family)
LKQKVNVETAYSDEVCETSVGEENSSFASLSASLAEIRKLEGVIGYILRSSTSAIFDIDDYDKIFQYAILTSEIYESNVEITKQFNLGLAESVLLEGENTKVLCLSMDDNKINVFMNNTADHAWITKKIIF